MDRCHICEESVAMLHSEVITCLVLEGVEYPLCPVHALKMGDYMVTLLQQHLNEKKGTKSL